VLDFSFTLEKAELWWPHNIGNPRLHIFEFYLRHSLTDEILDSKIIKYGIRTVKLQNSYDSI
jgi:beta-galactosidase/beta-glucuronidase